MISYADKSTYYIHTHTVHAYMYIIYIYLYDSGRAIRIKKKIKKKVDLVIGWGCNCPESSAPGGLRRRVGLYITYTSII